MAEAVELGQLFEHAPGYIAVVSGPDHVFRVANAAYRRLMGREDIVGRKVIDVLPELEAQGFIALLDDVLASGEPYVASGVPVDLPAAANGDKETRLISFVYQPMRDAAGTVTGIFAEGVDVTPSAEADAARRQAEQRLEAVVNNASVAIFLMDEKQQCSFMNPAAERLTGYSFEETRGRRLHEVIHHTRPDGSPFPLEECPIDRAFPENNNMQGEEVFVHKDGHFYPVAFTASPIRDHASKTVGTIIEVRDISAEKQAQERQQLLINELNHRVKNTLAIVQSLAHQSFRERSSSLDARHALESRLMALAAAHDVLTRRNWEAAALAEMIGGTVAPYRGEPDRFSIEGPNLSLAPETAIAVAMAMHELATNAAKYGALSSPAGTVSVRWTVEEGLLRLTWHERGGPAVAAPERQGFGTRMIERALATELHGTVSLDFHPEGLRCVIEAPWPHEQRSS